ncbi:MAG TPA: exodeoxyribonuclease VII large subunit [Gammaproteobacteria bacterium]|nr:exodeoxyribonuclease VII large subunit [Gammaproteobacteria bacterium]
MTIIDLEESTEIYTVSEFNADVRDVLEDNFDQIWIEGEISNFVAAGSGHWYFSLKDADAQVRCAMFKGSQRKIGFTPKNGLHVLLRARVSLYEPRGDFQLIADFMEERGEGKLRRAFEALKKKLEAAGWFDELRKKEIPEFPKCIGVVTSPTGAAIRDILHVLKRRYPSAPIIIYPTLVQGDTAAPAIAKAIHTANERKECDVLIVARGGGSLEDLWPFNEEITAKAIYESKLPVISGVGHEIDFTIADFVADVRAPTPSAAAEIAVPDRNELLQTLLSQGQQVVRFIRQRLTADKQNLAWMQKHLQQQHPKRRIIEKMQQLDFCEARFVQLQNQMLNRLQMKTSAFATRLHQVTPHLQIQRIQQRLQQQSHQLTTLIHNDINIKHSQLAHAAATLDGISPLATLKRGYSIATDSNDKILHRADDVNKGDNIKVKLLQGALVCRVEEKA